eukprot:CAMPEP_0198338866 /NCGR_PEP_ID=MMETSP1450-20131203/37597_1 /TAXON_ID=753684 ORGANISM="Madagascaria erythrocladiodes, Strain CCMP3234" /NCGR_SAMPLE_ID=MMETSP1450 /ASSEMBLY_ACC=CAM_ASM_001115 /LENGTH=325 /DNA_ID=CAMNT_0044043765 /DNA_START=77 /DNA_END=1051 /DNA_ORIENTATION=+
MYVAAAAIAAAATVAVAVATAATAAAARQRVCRALALGGGGDRGSYEAGVFAGFVDNPSLQGSIEYDVLSGVSAGSLNALALSLFAKGDERAAANFLRHQWLTMSRSKVYRNWLGGPIEGITLRSGLFDLSPAERYLKSLPLRNATTSGRHLLLGTTDYASGEFVLFNETEPDLAGAALASCTVPGIFPVRNIRGRAYVDGGVVNMTPVTDAVRACKAIADKVIVDVVLALGGPPKDVSGRWLLTPLVTLRAFMLLLNSVFYKDVQQAAAAFPDIEISVTAPSKELAGWLLEFSTSNAKVNADIGYGDGLRTTRYNATHFAADAS